MRGDLDDGPALLIGRVGDVRGDQIDPGHVEANDACRLAGDGGILRVDLIGAVDLGATELQSAERLQRHEATRVGDVIQGQLLLGSARCGVCHRQ